MVRSRGLAGLLTAQAVSFTGTRVSMIALPWFVLVTSGSATRTGLVAFCEMTPYILTKGLGGPIIDRVGPRRVSVRADAISTVAVAAIPLLHTVGLLSFGVLLGLVAVAGAARGPGDTAKSTLLPDVAAAADVPLERVTGLSGTIDRLTQTVGPLLGGVLVAWLAPLTALLVDAASFAVAAALIASTTPRRRGEAVDEQGYLRRFRTGLDFLVHERLLRAIAVMVAVTNMVDTAILTVLLPVWARDHGGPATLGAVMAAAGATAVLGSVAATILARRLPRRATYFVAFLLAGAPRIAVLALGVPLWLVTAVWAVAGLGMGLINPILSATLYELIPRHLLGRTWALTSTLVFAGVPLGGLLGGALVSRTGLSPAVVICAAVYLVATALPGLRPEWQRMDAPRYVASAAAGAARR